MRWSEWWVITNAAHLPGMEARKTYVGRMSSVLKDMITAMQLDPAGPVDLSLLSDVKSLVVDAEKLFKSPRRTATEAADAMVVLDDATLRVLRAMGPPDPYPGSPTFTNPEADLASHLTALRYAVCSELAHATDLPSCAMDPDVEDELAPF